MITQGAAMRIGEAAAEWLRRREPSAWLTLSILVLKDDGNHHVVPRTETIAMLEKARAKATASGRGDLARELSSGIDLVKAAAPIEVPVVIFFEHEDGAIETGVITLKLPRVDKAHKKARGVPTSS